MVGIVAAKTAVVGVLGAVAGIAKTLATTQKNDSLVQFTSVLRAEPITMIDKRLERVDYLPDVLQTLLSMFCGYYMQAVSCLIKVGDINVLRMLDALNPSRDGAMATGSLVDAINGKQAVGMLSMESYEDRALPMPSQISLEDVSFGKARAFLKDSDAFVKRQQVGGTLDAKMGDTGKAIKAAQEVVNLAVGKILEVNVESNGNRGVFPVSVRLATAVIDHEVLLHILGSSGRDNSYRERYHRWKAGDLLFWKDLVLCQDLIEENKKLLLKDKTGALAELNQRRAGNSFAALASGTPSIGSASAMSVISKDTAMELERLCTGKFTDVKFRNRIMQDSMSMLLVVVDTDYESITIYTRDIQLPSKFSIRELKAANKGSGPDIGELLKMYKAGQSPVF